MPLPSPFHSRTAPLCESHEWRIWSGYLAASMYEPTHEREYYAIRNAAALIDVSPLFKYEFHGPGAAQAVNRIITRDVSRCAVGQVLYSPWCDDDGKVIDDGTIARLNEDTFRMTAAESNLTWFQDCSLGFDCTVKDISGDLAALALQGPNSRHILEQIFSGMYLTDLGYYHLAHGYAGSIPLTVTRTGYTGDLGYELWVAPELAENLWDVLIETGKGHGLAPAGMVALDIARIEAGLIMLQVDYISSRKALIEAQKSSPFEIGLGWTVDLEKGDFVGHSALQKEKKNGSQWRLVGLEVKWESLEELYGQVGLVPQISGRASRSPVPIYKEELHIGQATSMAFSPILKKSIAIGTVESQHAKKGASLQIETTVEYVRHRAEATIVPLPFFNPPRKRA